MSEKIGAAPTGHPNDSAARRTHWRGAAAPLNVWQQAIDAELVSAHLGVALNDATFEGAQKAIHELICWHIDVATNPATNGGQRLTDAKPIVWPVAMPEPVAAQVRFKPENDTTWSRWKVCAVEDAREIEAYTLVNCWNYEVRYLHAEQQVRELLATPNNLPAQAVEKSATHGMDLHQRILHVGGRENAQTYIEFGSVAAVRALVVQVLRDWSDGAHGFA